MRKIREVLRLRLEAGLSIQKISTSTKTSVGAIQKLLARADALTPPHPLVIGSPTGSPCTRNSSIKG